MADPSARHSLVPGDAKNGPPGEGPFSAPRRLGPYPGRRTLPPTWVWLSTSGKLAGARGVPAHQTIAHWGGAVQTGVKPTALSDMETLGESCSESCPPRPMIRSGSKREYVDPRFVGFRMFP